MPTLLFLRGAILTGALAASGTLLAPGTARASAPDPGLSSIAQSAERTPAMRARDAVRHPVEELTFFGITPNSTVLELWPAPGYWTELLGPYLAAGGRYLVAHPPRGSAENDAGYKSWSERVARLKAHMGPITETTLGKGQYELAPPGSVDLVLTFRNLHNWVGEGDAGQVLAACFKALKPGGILGVEDHRGRGDRPQDPKAASGYLREDFAIDLIRHAGFELVGKSELNANPKDTTDWPRGVWTLPPSFALGAQDHDKYAAIGEADNFVLKFRKPLR